jgi:hypothetical protein
MIGVSSRVTKRKHCQEGGAVKRRRLVKRWRDRLQSGEQADGDQGHTAPDVRRDDVQPSAAAIQHRRTGKSLMQALPAVKQQHGDDDNSINNLTPSFRHLDH